MGSHSTFWRRTSVTATIACTLSAPLFMPPALAAPLAPAVQNTTPAPAVAPTEGVPAGANGADAEVPTHSDENIDPERIQVSAAAAADPAGDMSKVGSQWGFGAETSGTIGIGSGYWVKFFQGGTVVYSPGKGSVPMANEVYQRWIHETRQGWGQPLYSERIDRGIKTYFANGAYVLDQNSALIMRADQHVGAGDIITIGDSQVWRDSWVGQGISQAGFKPWLYRCGGTGIVTPRADIGCRTDHADGTVTYSNGTSQPISGDINYFKGVVENRWLLPDGAPRSIYIQGSGNDADKNFADVDHNARRIIQTLKKVYPGTQIILTDVISQKPTDIAERMEKGAKFPDKFIEKSQGRGVLGEKLRKIAQEEKITFISYKWWVSDYRFYPHQYDFIHFYDQDQNIPAGPMKDSLLAALRGNTLKGGIGQFHADQGGTARFGAPVSNEVALRDGGVYQAFANQYSIYWTPQLGAHSVKFSGAIGRAYRAGGYENAYGFPAEEETAYAYGTRQTFNLNGKETRFYWAPNTGVHTMNGRGSIFAKWVSLGHANTLGFPVTEEISAGNGGAVQYTRTEDGREFGLYWSPSTGTHVINSKGAIYRYFMNNGYTSTFGFPMEDEHLGADGRVHVKFSKGQELTWSASEGVRVR